MKFSYRARSSSGKDQYGRLDAVDTSVALEQIRQMGYTPLDVVEVPAYGVFTRMFPSGRIAQRDRIIFFRQLATMVSAGVSLTESLSVLAAQTENPRFRTIVSAIAAQVRGGSPLSEAFMAHPRCFPDILPALLKMGEESGRLEEILQRFADAMERRNELRQKIMTALAYPAAVIMIALTAAGVLTTVIIPQFETVFANLNAEVPRITSIAFAIGRGARHSAPEAGVSLLTLSLLIYFCSKNGRAKESIDRLRLKLPVFGEIYRHAAYARAFRSMYLLLSSGVAIAEALELSGRAAANDAIRKDFISVRKGVVMGSAMHRIMAEDGSFCPMVRHMIAVGEETGKTDAMFEKLGLWYEAELTEKVRRLTTLLEPFVIVLAGLVVAFMAFSVFLPVISSIQNLI